MNRNKWIPIAILFALISSRAFGQYATTTEASSAYSASFKAANAVDGLPGTRWSSAEPYGKAEWLQIDLGSIKPIGRIEISWETAYAKGYRLSISNDANTWQQIFLTGAGDGGLDVLNNLKTSGRYLKLDCLERGSGHGYSIREFKAFAETASAMQDLLAFDADYVPLHTVNETLEFTATQPYLLFPILNETKGADAKKGTSLKVHFTIDGQKYGPIRLTLPTSAEDVDWYGHFPLAQFQGKKVTVQLNGVTKEAFELIRQSDTLPGEESFYSEALRPQLHFSARTGWLNDPNGLLYYKGEYHMYFQHNPYSVNWGNMSWGHAVSKDLIHWEEKPVVLFPNEQGLCYSGAAFIDRRNQLGLKTGAEEVIVAFYLRTAIGLAYAYSNDGGNSFTEYDGNPVLTHKGARLDTPRPLWYEPTQRWVAPTYDFFINNEGKKLRCVGFYSSENLIDWTYESRVEQDKWGDELCGCVDFFQLPIDGDPKNKKWVMIMIDGSYIIGTFDGKTFFNKDGNPASTQDRIKSLVVDRNYYATMTWHNMPDDRRVQITWMKRRKPFPGMPYGEQMSLPSEMTLHSSPEGPRLRMNPIREFETLRTNTLDLKDVVLDEQTNPLNNAFGELFELEVAFAPAKGSITTFDMRGIVVSYDADQQLLTCGPAKTKLAPIDGNIQLDIILDRTGIEVYGNDGRVYIPVIQAPKQDNKRLKASCSGGKTVLSTLRLHELQSIWK